MITVYYKVKRKLILYLENIWKSWNLCNFIASLECQIGHSDHEGQLDQHISELHLSLIIRQSLWRLPSHDNNTSNYKSQILYDLGPANKTLLSRKKTFLLNWILSTCTASIIYIIVMVTGTCTYTQDSAL